MRPIPGSFGTAGLLRWLQRLNHVAIHTVVLARHFDAASEQTVPALATVAGVLKRFALSLGPNHLDILLLLANESKEALSTQGPVHFAPIRHFECGLPQKGHLLRPV